MQRIRFATVLIAWGIVVSGNAEEGGTAHYLPGSMSSFMDGVSPEETFLVRYQSIWYQGEIAIAMTMAGLSIAGNVDAETWANGLTLFWRPPMEISDGWSYALSATIPVIHVQVEADVLTPQGIVPRSDSLTGPGDIVLQPLMLNYSVNPDFNINTRLSVYAPTGDYEPGRLANTGKNYWTFEPKVGFTYFGQKNGREASIFTGAAFNTENPDTDYETGTQMTVDGTLAQHLPLWNGLAGVGISGYCCDQVEGDSGSPDFLGAFRGRTAGFGPAISFVKKTSSFDLLTELKWLHEAETRNRLQVDYV